LISHAMKSASMVGPSGSMVSDTSCGGGSARQRFIYSRREVGVDWRPQ
jgi:hypothetical protein